MASGLITGLTPIWHITVEQYHAMLEHGIFHSDDPIELLDGVIVQKPVKNPWHSVSNDAARQALEGVIRSDWCIRVQNPITLATSEPEPDLAVVRENPRDYSSRHPNPNQVGLVIEIADSSLERDRVLKQRIYADAGIPWYWLVDLRGRALEVYSQPANHEFGRQAGL
jgi:Uma2 family endonuclease